MKDGLDPGYPFVHSISAFYISDFSVSLIEDKLDGDHFVTSCKLVTNERNIQTHALIDTGCSGFAFIDEKFARHNNFPFHPLTVPRTLKVIDGRPVSSGNITHLCNIPLPIDSHREVVPFFVTKLGSYPLVLGIPWLQLHDPELRFKDNTINFNSDDCKNQCNSSQRPILVKRVIRPPKIQFTSTASLCRLARSKNFMFTREQLIISTIL